MTATNVKPDAFNKFVMTVVVFIIAAFCMSVVYNFKQQDFNGTFYDLLMPKMGFKQEFIETVFKYFIK